MYGSNGCDETANRINLENKIVKSETFMVLDLV